MTEAAMRQPEMKKCPACAELILADALKCKHCGERLDALPPAPKKSLSPEKKRQLAVMSVVLAGLAITGAVGWAAFRVVPETKLWVSIHKDVDWHRKWQDARTDDHRDRVVDIYQQILNANPENAELKYLALRALPDGDAKLERFREAAKKFDQSGWILLGLAAAQENDGSVTEANETREKAIQLFGANVPAVAYRALVVGLARDEQAEALKDFYEKNREPIRSSVPGATGMAEASFLLGDLDAMVKWEEHARTLGYDGPEVSAPLKKSVDALGLAPNLVGRRGVFRGLGEVQIVNFTAKPADGGTELVLRLKYTNLMWDEEQPLYKSNFALIPVSGEKIQAWGGFTTLADVPANRSVTRAVQFQVPAGTRIRTLEIDTMRFRLNSRSHIMLNVDLAPDPEFKVEHQILP